MPGTRAWSLAKIRPPITMGMNFVAIESFYYTKQCAFVNVSSFVALQYRHYTLKHNASPWLPLIRLIQRRYKRPTVFTPL
jgi:hypothetical protein